MLVSIFIRLMSVCFDELIENFSYLHCDFMKIELVFASLDVGKYVNQMNLRFLFNLTTYPWQI